MPHLLIRCLLHEVDVSDNMGTMRLHDYSIRTKKRDTGNIWSHRKLLPVVVVLCVVLSLLSFERIRPELLKAEKLVTTIAGA